MLNIIILVLAVVTLALMTSDPRASKKESIQSAWQQNTLSSEIQDFTSKPKSQSRNDTEQT
ncbi:ABZJ_00068 family colistin stress protein [Acinetobacter sp. ANC 3781]